MELTVEQQKALALARARQRAAQGSQPSQGAAPEAPPAADEQPWYAKAGRAAMDIGRIAVDTPTFGVGDRVLAGIESLGTGKPYDETLALHRQATADARERAGWAGTATDLVTGVSALSRLPSFVGGAKGLAKGLIAGAEGAGYGALSAAGHGTDLETGALTGAAGGVAGLAAGQAAGRVMDSAGQAFKRLAGKAPKVPSSAELEALAREAYRSADDAGVILSKPGLDKLKGSIQQEWTELAMDKDLHPKAYRVWQKLDEMAQGNVTLSGLETLRKLARSAYDPTQKHQNKLLEKAVKRIDRFVAEAEPGDIVDGNVRQGAQALKDARALWSRKAKSDMVEQAIAKGERMAATNASGGNTENEVRKQIRQILTNPKKTRGFTPDELAQAEVAARGTPLNNALRQVGRLSPQGNGVGMMFGLGGLTAASPQMLAGSLAGMAAKPLSTRLSTGQAQTLAEMMRAGGTRSALRGPDNLPQRLAQPVGDRVAKALLAAALLRAHQPQD